MTLDELVTRFDNAKRSGDGYSVRCSAHDDEHNSLSLGQDSTGHILIHCHAGCVADVILLRVGLNWHDLLADKSEPEIIATYDYKDEHGQLLYQVVRFHPKDFRQRQPDGTGGWIWNVAGVRRVPYRLPELIKQPKGKIFFIVEGERDADLLWSLGFPATTNAGGAGKWNDAFSEFFEKRQVVILPDNDEPGRNHAKAVEASLRKYRAQDVWIVRLPGLQEKGDVSDWFRTKGNDAKLFDEIIYDAFHESEVEREGMQETYDIDSAEAQARFSWNPYDLVRNSSIVSPEGFLYGEIFPRQTVSEIYGASGSGKSYFVMYLGGQIATGREVHGMKTNPGRVLFLSQEMNGPELRFRADVMWDSETLNELAPNRFHFHWDSFFDFGGKSLKDNRSVGEFLEICARANKPDIVFIDSLSRIHHAKENDNQEMGIVMQNLELAARLANVALVVVHHATKPSEFREGKERSRGASCIMATMNDAVQVDCISSEDKKSIVSFTKTRSIAGRPVPAPFMFTQELDPSGRVVLKRDGSTVSAYRFVIGNAPAEEARAKRTVAEQQEREVKEQLENLLKVGDNRIDAGKIRRQDLISIVRDSRRWSQSKAARAIDRATMHGLLEREKRPMPTGSDEIFLWPTDEEN